jgi:hypothetical protein
MDHQPNSRLVGSLHKSNSPTTAGAAALLSRLNRALEDLGLLTTLGGDWVTYVDGTVRFGALSSRAADALLRTLEELDPLPNGSVSTPALKQYISDLTAVPLPVSPNPVSRRSN